MKLNRPDITAAIYCLDVFTNSLRYYKMADFNIDTYYIPYANCIPVKGVRRSLICDLQIGRYYYIPNDLFEILSSVKSIRLSDMFKEFDVDDHQTLNEYFDFLIKNNLGFLDDEPNLFPDLSREWDFPGRISNAIIDVEESNISKINYEKALNELSTLGCYCIQLRCFDLNNLKLLEDTILRYTLDSTFREIRLVLPFIEENQKYLLDQLLRRNKRITHITYFNCEVEKVESLIGVTFRYMSNKTLSAQDCGQTCASNFSINVQHFTEALHFNSCLNRKISLDAKGFIKNCPSQSDNFGHINETSLIETHLNEKFQSLWKIRKDDIDVCKVCEYRYICTDCRIFRADSNSLHSKPSKCKYDPYSTTWN